MRRLRLNRPPLVALRLRRQAQAEEGRLLSHYQTLIELLAQLTEQQAELLKEQQLLLEEQKFLLTLLLLPNQDQD